MNETSDRQRRRNKQQPAVDASDGDDARVRKAMDERCEAVRRWIGYDDDVACRGID
jgi:hypothetical protein